MNDTFQAIIDAIKRQEHHHAENLCWAALKKQPNSSELNKWLGVSLLQQKKYEGAVAALLQSLPDKKNDFDVVTAFQIFEHMIAPFTDKARYKPNQYAVTMNRAHISFNLKNYEEAFQLTEKCFDFIKNTQNELWQ